MTLPGRFVHGAACGAVVIGAWLAAAASIAADAPDDSGRQWVRTRPFALMGLVLTTSKFDPDKYTAAGFSYLLAWKLRENILADASRANLPWFGHLLAPQGATEEVKIRVREIMVRFPGNVGLLVNDEPKLSQMAPTREVIAWLKAEYPDRLFTSNLYPFGASGARYAGDPARGAYSYRDYVRDYIRIVRPPVLMFDVYPFKSGDRAGAISSSYYLNLAVIRQEALAAGIPYWVFVQAYENPKTRHRLPSDSDLRMQTFSALTFGYTGLALFSYDAVFERGLMDGGGKPTDLYRDAQKLSAELKYLGRSLRLLTSTGVFAVTAPGGERFADPAYVAAWKADYGGERIRAIEPVAGSTRAGALLGHFRDDAGGRYFMLTNLAHGDGMRASDAQATYRLVFHPSVRVIQRLDRTSGRVERVGVKQGEGLTIALPGGTGELYKYDDGSFAGVN